jgi:hypothetical protein
VRQRHRITVIRATRAPQTRSTQLVRIAGREDGTVIVSPDRDLADDRQPAGVGVERFADQIVDDAGAVVLGRSM